MRLLQSVCHSDEVFAQSFPCPKVVVQHHKARHTGKPGEVVPNLRMPRVPDQANRHVREAADKTLCLQAPLRPVQTEQAAPPRRENDSRARFLNESVEQSNPIRVDSVRRVELPVYDDDALAASIFRQEPRRVQYPIDVEEDQRLHTSTYRAG